MHYAYVLTVLFVPVPHCIRLYCTVLGVKIFHTHDISSYAVLKHIEVEFSCGTHRYDLVIVQRLDARAAHFGATVLKTRPTGQGRMPKFPEPGNLTFSGGGGNVDEMD